MGTTEQDLWRSLAPVAKGTSHRLTRIETGDTALGVSDIEYVGPEYNGWIETKILLTSQPKSMFALNTDFTLQQYQWLLEHHNPKRYRYSWLLVGQPKRGVQGWERFIMIPAPVTTRLIREVKPTNGEVLQWPQVISVRTAGEVLACLSLGGV